MTAPGGPRRYGRSSGTDDWRRLRRWCPVAPGALRHGRHREVVEAVGCERLFGSFQDPPLGFPAACLPGLARPPHRPLSQHCRGTTVSRRTRQHAPTVTGVVERAGKAAWWFRSASTPVATD